jgi:hypothetical protein
MSLKRMSWCAVVGHFRIITAILIWMYYSIAVRVPFDRRHQGRTTTSFKKTIVQEIKGLGERFLYWEVAKAGNIVGDGAMREQLRHSIRFRLKNTFRTGQSNPSSKSTKHGSQMPSAKCQRVSDTPASPTGV